MALPQVLRDTNSANAPQYEKRIMITVNSTANASNDYVNEMRYIYTLIIIMKIKLIAIYYYWMPRRPLTELNIINYLKDCVTEICVQLYYDY